MSLKNPISSVEWYFLYKFVEKSTFPPTSIEINFNHSKLIIYIDVPSYPALFNEWCASFLNYSTVSLFSANKVEKSFPIILKIQILSVLIIPRSAWYSHFITRICPVLGFLIPGSAWYTTHYYILHSTYVIQDKL